MQHFSPVSVFLILLFLISGVTFLHTSPLVEQACAKTIEPGEECPAGGINPYRDAIHSVEVPVTVNVIAGVMQPGSQVQISAAFQDRRTAECNVLCLLREENPITQQWYGSSITHTFINLGCSSGTCNDNLDVTVQLSDSNCRLANGGQSETQTKVANRNSTNVSYTFDVVCEVPPATVPPATLQPPTATLPPKTPPTATQPPATLPVTQPPPGKQCSGKLQGSCPNGVPTLTASWNVQSNNGCNIFLEPGGRQISTNCSGSNVSIPISNAGTYVLYVSDNSGGGACYNTQVHQASVTCGGEPTQPPPPTTTNPPTPICVPSRINLSVQPNQITTHTRNVQVLMRSNGEGTLGWQFNPGEGLTCQLEGTPGDFYRNGNRYVHTCTPVPGKKGSFNVSWNYFVANDNGGAQVDCPPVQAPYTIIGPTDTPTPTPTPLHSPTPTPTPTPAFSEDMCKCDDITSTPLFPGQSAQITAFSRVEKKDANIARVVDVTFTAGKIDGQRLTNPSVSNPIPAVFAEDKGSYVRYKATWTYNVPNFPANERQAAYQIIANTRCAPRTTAYVQPQTRSVLAATSGFLCGIFPLFPWCRPTDEVGGRQDSPAADPRTTYAPRNNLQLEPLYPGRVTNDSCNRLRVEFQNP